MVKRGNEGFSNEEDDLWAVVTVSLARMMVNRDDVGLTRGIDGLWRKRFI